jgi:penicillin-binding protein 1A
MKTFKGGGGTLANCLAFSKNTASVRITNLVGVKRVIEFAKSCGIKADLPPYTSLALGAAEIPMLEMLQAYTMFPNKSLNTQPVLFTRIEDKSGNILQEFIPETKQVMSEASAFTMVQLMQGVVKFGTASRLNSYNIPVEKAGKTGTTDANADGWFIGYTPELLAGTWVGCEDPFIRIYAGTSGGNELAAPKWGIFMSKVYADKKLGYGKQTVFEKPTNMGTEPLSADTDWGKVFMQGGDSTVDEGNGKADDFIDAPATDLAPQENIGIESEIPKTPVDTGKSKNKEAKVTMPAALKPADNKPKTPAPAKPKTGNDY